MVEVAPAPKVAVPAAAGTLVAVKLTDEPAQMVSGVWLIVLINGRPFTVTLTVEEAEQAPSTPLTVYVYVPAAVGTTCVIAGVPKLAVPPLVVPEIPDSAAAADHVRL